MDACSILFEEQFKESVVAVITRCVVQSWRTVYVAFYRNYHVFYYLLLGASEEERKEFKLLPPEEYFYLKQVW